MRFPLYFVLPLALGLAVPAAQAQLPSDHGSMVRIRSTELSSGRTSGVLQRVTADSVVVSGLAISRSSISRIDVSTGRKSHLLKGMGIGLLSGAALGALGCSVACGGSSESDYKGIITAVGAGVGGLAGLGMGALIGSKKTEQWSASSLSTLRISPIVRSNGGRGVTLGFQF